MCRQMSGPSTTTRRAPLSSPRCSRTWHPNMSKAEFTSRCSWPSMLELAWTSLGPLG
ncbi:unnamed protein product [Symbiodinium pilosum]|uniref:Uncharacterized protein n=1 Tax=Symbiodinium pilosum TaxID=2952 RepID=A0A812XY23_SYMPI|nr:unnamed protein product [Symbiodinium pilosum]